MYKKLTYLFLAAALLMQPAFAAPELVKPVYKGETIIGMGRSAMVSFLTMLVCAGIAYKAKRFRHDKNPAITLLLVFAPVLILKISLLKYLPSVHYLNFVKECKALKDRPSLRATKPHGGFCLPTKEFDLIALYQSLEADLLSIENALIFGRQLLPHHAQIGAMFAMVKKTNIEARIAKLEALADLARDRMRTVIDAGKAIAEMAPETA